jgi:hypothetical protein
MVSNSEVPAFNDLPFDAIISYLTTKYGTGTPPVLNIVFEEAESMNSGLLSALLTMDRITFIFTEDEISGD